MKVNDFIREIHASVLDDNSTIYRDLFESTTVATDPYWKRALVLFQALDAGQREVFFEVLQQVSIDALSGVFAVIDGVVTLNGEDGPIRLLSGSDDLTGELQDSFLRYTET